MAQEKKYLDIDGLKQVVDIIDGKIEEIYTEIDDITVGQVECDTELSIDSEKPVQNKVIKEAFDDILNGTTAVGNALKLNGLTAEEFVSNENLLINADDFKNPVNSSGATEWTSTGTTIDKWVMHNTNATVSLGADGLVFTKVGTSYGLVYQTLEYELERLAGKTLTLSVEFDGAVLSATFTLPNVIEASYAGTRLAVGNGYIQVIRQSNNANLWLRYVMSDDVGTTHTISWIKLELGSVATPPTPPNKEVEKLKCLGMDKIPTYLGLVTDTTFLTDTTVKYPYICEVDANTAVAIGLAQLHWVIEYNPHCDFNGYGIQRATPCDPYTKAEKPMWRNSGGAVWFPWTYSADGGNADTVDGLHASDFIKTGGRVSTLGFDGEYDLYTDIDGTKHSIPFGWTRDSLRADLAKYLPLDGSVPMSGDLKTQNGWNWLGGNSAHTAVGAYNVQSDYNNYRALRILNSTFESNTENALEFYEIIDGVGTNRKVLHTGNMASHVLPLDGGTLSGDLSVTKSGNTTARIIAQNDGAKIGMITNTDGGYGLWDYQTNTYLIGRLNGNLLMEGNTPLHTGNYTTHVTPANIGAAASSHTHSYLPLIPASIELTPASGAGHGGFLDFHFNGSSADNTSRIIESTSGTLNINGVTITTGKVVTATTFSGALSGNASTATYATTAHAMRTYAANGTSHGATSWLLNCKYNHKSDGRFWMYVGDGTVHSVGCDYATTAGSANAVTWANVSGKPSTFTPTSHNQSASTITTGTFPAAVGFANGILNPIGDDAYLGDQNVAGCVCIKGNNGATGIQFIPQSGSTTQKISINGSGMMSVTGALNVAASTAYTTNQVRNTVFTTTDPGAGASTTHANGSIICVYE